MDREYLKYNLRDIRAHKDFPFQLANEKLADEQFPFIKAEFPDALMVKYDIFQYIVVTEHARLTLITELASIKSNHEQQIVEIEKAVAHLKAADRTSKELAKKDEEIKKMFEREEQLLEESHKQTMNRHREIMAAIDNVSTKKKKPTVIGVTMSL